MFKKLDTNFGLLQNYNLLEHIWFKDKESSELAAKLQTLPTSTLQSVTGKYSLCIIDRQYLHDQESESSHTDTNQKKKKDNKTKIGTHQRHSPADRKIWTQENSPNLTHTHTETHKFLCLYIVAKKICFCRACTWGLAVKTWRIPATCSGSGV
jgi:hypothetical protein